MGSPPSPFEVDLNRERSHDYRAVGRGRGLRISRLILGVGFVTVFTLGTLLGFFLGRGGDAQLTDEAVPSAVYTPQQRIVSEAERTVERRLVASTFEQAETSVEHAVGQSRNLASIFARNGDPPGEISLVVNTNLPGVRVRVGGSEVDSDGANVYRVRRDQPFVVEFDAPIDDPSDERDYHLSVSPLFEGLDIYDPYDPTLRP